MRDLPSGTVTFLFTDIEGSTRLLHEHALRGAARGASACAEPEPEFERGRAKGPALSLEAVARALEDEARLEFPP